MQNKQKSSVDAQIDENLKRAFEQVLQEEVPDRFRQLLDQLKAEEQQKCKKVAGSHDA